MCAQVSPHQAILGPIYRRNKYSGHGHGGEVNLVFFERWSWSWGEVNLPVDTVSGRGGEGMSSKVVGGIVSGVVLLLIGAVCCHFRKRIFPQRKPKQESPENPMHWRQPTTFYHATTEENALRIQDQGFIIPDGPGGLLGRGVYCTSTLKKAMDYLKSPYGGVILQLTVDLGKCIELVPDDPMMKTWQTQYDSAWAPFSAANPGDKGKEENCVKDPRRIKVVQALAGDTTALNRGGYAIINGKLCRV